MNNSFYKYTDDKISFSSQDAARLKLMYAPLCGIDSDSLKSSITPFLAGDIKIDKFRYLTKPSSREDLRNGLRNVYVNVNGKGVVSFADAGDSYDSRVEIGQLWHTAVRTFKNEGIEIAVQNFIPASEDTVELMRVTIKNITGQTLRFTPTVAVPLFARALENKHDHEHVTALLHRIEQITAGVLVEPVMRFNEEGHQPNEVVYFVYGICGQGLLPAGTYPTALNFLGETGDILRPEAVFKGCPPRRLPAAERHGHEAMGALQFVEESLTPGEVKEYIVAAGISPSAVSAEDTFQKFNSISKIDSALAANKDFWRQKSNAIVFQCADEGYSSWMRWVTIQPVLRRIFGCSFLPDHDYGKGGKGWRDLWQDLLSLILIEPDQVREQLLNNFAGVRIDGSNATIIGSAPGEFIADRNAITRVWMDHGVWPLMTLLLYVHQTGDYDILNEKVTYFRDPQQSRTFKKDKQWDAAYGHQLKDEKGQVVTASVIEHLLVQNLVQFFNVGEHNIIRLESADWNDGLDMAFDRGESTAFMSAYARNLFDLAQLLEKFAAHNELTELKLTQEVSVLLDTLSDNPLNYDYPKNKQKLLFDKYFSAVEPEVSGDVVEVGIQDIVQDLRKKGQWIFDYIQENERISVDGHVWFNGYYDNQGERVEGKKENGIWMTLTGQVFAVMSGLAEESDVREVIKSVDRYLKDPELGGIRLNTDFGVRHYLDFGRAFGFAYGTKENGAFFSHMIVMYANALYQRGFALEGYRVLQSIYRMCMDTDRSKIYPGIPEYFDSLGRGMYHYLTGSASWLVLTELTQAFGIRGQYGDLFIAPQLVKEQFDARGQAGVQCQFAGKRVEVIFTNPEHKEFGGYKVKNVLINDQVFSKIKYPTNQVCIPRDEILEYSTVQLEIILG